MATDPALEAIRDCTDMRRLDLGLTAVSTDGIKTLTKTLPDCKIQR
jgi:hypothetical protein